MNRLYKYSSVQILWNFSEEVASKVIGCRVRLWYMNGTDVVDVSVGAAEASGSTALNLAVAGCIAGPMKTGTYNLYVEFTRDGEIVHREEVLSAFGVTSMQAEACNPDGSEVVLTFEGAKATNVTAQEPSEGTVAELMPNRMQRLYRYSTATIEWDLSREMTARPELGGIDAVLEITAGKTVNCYAAVISGMTLRHTLSNPMDAGVYSCVVRWHQGGKTVFEAQALQAFMVCSEQQETLNPDGGSVTVKVSQSRVTKIVTIPLEEGEDDMSEMKLPILYKWGRVNIVWDMHRELAVRPELKGYGVELYCQSGNTALNLAATWQGTSLTASLDGPIETGTYSCFARFKSSSKTVLVMTVLQAWHSAEAQGKVLNPDGAAVTLNLRSGRVYNCVVTPLVDPTDIARLGDLMDVDLKTKVPARGDVLKYDGTRWIAGNVYWDEVREKPVWLTKDVPDLGAFGNKAGYIKGITAQMVTDALGYEPLKSVTWHDVTDKPRWVSDDVPDLGAFGNKAGYIRGITAEMVIKALGYEPGDGVRYLWQLGDVDITGVADGHALMYDAVRGCWRTGVAGGGSVDPSVLSGYLTKKEALERYLTKEEFAKWFFRYEYGDGEWAIGTSRNFFSKNGITAYGPFKYGEGGGGGGGISSWDDILDRPQWLDNFKTGAPDVSYFRNDAGYIKASYLTENGYVKRTSLGDLAFKNKLWFSELEGTPTTLAGYGITDALQFTKSENGEYVQTYFRNPDLNTLATTKCIEWYAGGWMNMGMGNVHVNGSLRIGDALLTYENGAIKVSASDGKGVMNLYATGGITAYGAGAQGGGGAAGASYFADLLDVVSAGVGKVGDLWCVTGAKRYGWVTPNYLGKTDKAVDSAKLGGVNGDMFLRAVNVGDNYYTRVVIADKTEDVRGRGGGWIEWYSNSEFYNMLVGRVASGYNSFDSVGGYQFAVHGSSKLDGKVDVEDTMNVRNVVLGDDCYVFGKTGTKTLAMFSIGSTNGNFDIGYDVARNGNNTYLSGYNVTLQSGMGPSWGLRLDEKGDTTIRGVAYANSNVEVAGSVNIARGRSYKSDNIGLLTLDEGNNIIVGSGAYGRTDIKTYYRGWFHEWQISTVGGSDRMMRLYDSGLSIGDDSWGKPGELLHVAGDSMLKGRLFMGADKLGYIVWDAEKSAFKVNGNLYATGGITAYGAGSGDLYFNNVEVSHDVMVHNNLTVDNVARVGGLTLGGDELSYEYGTLKLNPGDSVYIEDLYLGEGHVIHEEDVFKFDSPIMVDEVNVKGLRIWDDGYTSMMSSSRQFVKIQDTVIGKGGTLQTSSASLSYLQTNSMTINGFAIRYDSVNHALCFDGNIYATGGITAYGAGTGNVSFTDVDVRKLVAPLIEIGEKGKYYKGTMRYENNVLVVGSSWNKTTIESVMIENDTVEAFVMARGLKFTNGDVTIVNVKASAENDDVLLITYKIGDGSEVTKSINLNEVA